MLLPVVDRDGRARLLPARPRDLRSRSRTPTATRSAARTSRRRTSTSGSRTTRHLDDDPNFRNVLEFTGVWTFVNVFFHFTIGLGLALMLNRTLRFRGTYRMLLLVPWAVPSFITALRLALPLQRPVRVLRPAAAHDRLSTARLRSSATRPGRRSSVIAVNVWLGIPFMMVALLGGLQAIDTELLDAAAVDGAIAWQRFWDVTLPGLRPVAATVILLGLIWTFNMFDVIFLITQGGPADSTQILVTYSYRYFLDYQLYGVAAAYGVIILSILLVFSTFYRMVGALDGRGELVLMAVDTHAARGRAARPRRRSGRGARFLGRPPLHAHRRHHDRDLPGVLDRDLLVQAERGDQDADRPPGPAGRLDARELPRRPHAERLRVPPLAGELRRGRAVHDGRRRVPRGDRGVRLLALPLSRLPGRADGPSSSRRCSRA